MLPVRCSTAAANINSSDDTMRTALIIASLAVTCAGTLSAQTPATPAQGGEELIDRVVAVVGDTVLLLSDVQADVQQMEAAGRRLPTDPRERERVIEQLVRTRVDDLILLEAARAQDITVRDEEVADMVNQEVQRVQQLHTDGNEHRSWA